MKSLAWLVAALIVVAGLIAIVAPDRVLALRSLEATQTALLLIAVIRIALGVVLIMTAPQSRAPKLLQVGGALLLGAGLATPLFGVDRTRAVLQWEAMQGPMFMRAIGVFVTVLGGGLTFVLTPRKQA